MIFLGSIYEYEGNWLETNEWKLSEREYGKGDILRLEVYTSQYLPRNDQTLQSHFIEDNLICFGDLAIKDIALTQSKLYSLELMTTVSLHGKTSKFTVGVISLNIAQEESISNQMNELPTGKMQSEGEKDDLPVLTVNSDISLIEARIEKYLEELRPPAVGQKSHKHHHHHHHRRQHHADDEIIRKSHELFGILCEKISIVLTSPNSNAIKSRTLKHYIHLLDMIFEIFLFHRNESNAAAPHSHRAEKGAVSALHLSRGKFGKFDELARYLTNHSELFLPVFVTLNYYLQVNPIYHCDLSIFSLIALFCMLLLVSFTGVVDGRCFTRAIIIEEFQYKSY